MLRVIRRIARTSGGVVVRVKARAPRRSCDFLGKSALLIGWGICFLGHASAAPNHSFPKLTAKAAAVMDADSGRLLWALHPDKPFPPASTTKIVTGMLCAQSVPPTRLIPISPYAAHLPGDRLGLRAGEKIPARDLLYAMLLISANDAAEAVAEAEGNLSNGLEGKQGRYASEPAAPFVRLMNAMAQKVGARHSHFVNPTGLPAPGQVSTARDLALLARAALTIPTFAQAVRTKTYVLHRPNEARPRVLVNTNRLLWTLPGAYGVKTGYTHEAGFCYVGAAAQKGHRVIVVLLHSDHWQTEALTLFHYGFERLSGIAAEGKGGARPVGALPDKAVPKGFGGGSVSFLGQEAPRNGCVARSSSRPTPFPSRPLLGSPGNPAIAWSRAPFPAGAGRPTAPAASQTSGGARPSPERQEAEESAGSAEPGGWASPGRHVPVANQVASQVVQTHLPFPHLVPILGLLLLASGIGIYWRGRPQWIGGIRMWLVGLSKRRKEAKQKPTTPLLSAEVVSKAETPPFQWEGLPLARRTAWEWLELLLEQPIRVLEPAIRWHLRGLLQADPSVERGRFRKILESHESLRVRLAMAEALEALAPRAVEKFARQLLEGEGVSADIRAEAAERLGAVGGERYEHFWLERLLKEPSLWATVALLRLVWLDNSTVQALLQALEVPLPEGASDELVARRRLRDGYIACVLFGHALLEEEGFLERFQWLPEEVQCELLVALAQKGKDTEQARLLLKRFLVSPSYALLRALCDMPPDTVESALNALDELPQGAEATRAGVVRWLLGKDEESALEQIRRLAEAGDDAAAHALQLQRVVHWNPFRCAPDALLAAAQIVSCRLGYLYYDPDYVTQVLRNALNEENALPPGVPDELKALATAYRNREVHDAVFAAMQSEENLLLLLMALSHYVDEERRYAQEIAFWCAKLPSEARYALLWALAQASDPEVLEAVENALTDSNSFVRSTARQMMLGVHGRAAVQDHQS
ncbi:D-alanyl-D-alanine carboxypeptidase [Chthonomonas calidirosea]|nr:D-alanyl-D-alanine carboxypeptidase [Chthonomonas calidirosea]